MTTPSTPSPHARTLKLRVSHGDLRDALYPVLVGHYTGEPPRRAERAADEALGRALSRRFHAGDPRPAFGAHIFEGAAGRLPPGALVVDLGEASEISRVRLSEAVTLAVRAYLCRPLGPEGRAGVEGLSAIPLGAFGPRALPVVDAIYALIEGVARAELAVRAAACAFPVDGAGAARLDELEIVALHEDQAIGAMHAAVGLAATQPWAHDGLMVDVHPTIRRLGGRLPALPRAPYALGRWREARVTVEGTSLLWEVGGDRAKVEHAVATAVQDAAGLLLPRLMRARIDDDAGGLARAGWNLLVPPETRKVLEQGGDLVLRLDREAAAIPWEALHPGAQAGQIMAIPGLVRRLLTPLPASMQPVATGRDVLVIADPLVAGQQLVGAREEARQLHALFEAQVPQFPCKVLCPETDIEGVHAPDAGDLVQRWHGRDWRIVHYAGHGSSAPSRQPDGSTPRRTSLTAAVVGPGGIATAFRVQAQHIAGMSPVPELVFLNCCHAGLILPDLIGAGPGVAASFAEQLIALGVRMVVVAAWPVEDRAARAFSKAFYEALLSGRTFGESVRAARQASHEPSRRLGVNTWTAYQCYGDPNARLAGLPSRAERLANHEGGLYLPSQVIDLLRSREEDLCARVLQGDPDLLNELDTLERSIPSALCEEGDVAEALGDLCLRCRALRRAREHFLRAMGAPQRGTSLGVVKKLADVELALATDQLLARPAEAGDAEALLAAAARRAELLVELTSSPMAFALRGAIHRRRAWLNASNLELRTAELKLSLDAYGQAARADGDSYPALAAATVGLLLGEVTNVEERLNEIRVRMERRLQEHPHFWVRAVRARLALLAALAGRPEGNPAALYLKLIDAHPSLWEVGHLRDDLWSLQELGSGSIRAPLDAMERALRDVLRDRAPGALALFEIRPVNADAAPPA